MTPGASRTCYFYRARTYGNLHSLVFNSQKSLTQKRLQVCEKKKVVSEEAEHLRQVIYLI